MGFESLRARTGPKTESCKLRTRLLSKHALLIKLPSFRYFITEMQNRLIQWNSLMSY